MVLTSPSTDILRWPVMSQWPSSRRVQCSVFAIPDHAKLILGICNIKEWWRWHSCILWHVLDPISCVTWLIYRCHRRGGHGSNFLTAVTYSSQSNSNLYIQKNNYVPKPPVELAHCFSAIWLHVSASFRYHPFRRRPSKQYQTNMSCFHHKVYVIFYIDRFYHSNVMYP